MNTAPAVVICDDSARASRSASSACSGASRLTRRTTSSVLSTTKIAPWSASDRVAIARRGSSASWLVTASATLSANALSRVIRTGTATSSCSACASRSAAIQRGSTLSSAAMTTSVGPAMESMPTSPNTSRLAAAT